MWKKKDRIFNILDIKLYATMRPQSAPFYMITWKTKDNLLHMCSFDTLKNTTINDDENIKFYIWEKE